MSELKRRRSPRILLVLAGILVVLVAVVLQVLDGWLLNRVRKEAAVYAAHLGRPIEIGGLSTKIFGRFGVKLENVTLGPAGTEQLPFFATLQRLEVRAALWPMLRSRGNDLQVHVVDIDRPEITVIRLADGTTNLDQLLARVEALPKDPEPTPAESESPSDLSGVKLDRFAVTDGRVRFVDRSGKAPHELAVNDLDITVEDLRAGQPLVVQIAAAVLAEKQNLQLSLVSTPLPPTLMPTPDRVELKSQPIDLSPLGPFLPEDVGFLAGSLEASFKAKLGRAVPGGEGPTEVLGVIRALGLKFRGSQGGAPLDIVVHSDLSGDATEGSLDLRKLEISFGPAQLSGKGRVSSSRARRRRWRGWSSWRATWTRRCSPATTRRWRRAWAGRSPDRSDCRSPRWNPGRPRPRLRRGPDPGAAAGPGGADQGCGRADAAQRNPAGFGEGSLWV